jgi:hypothetical protein
MLWAGLSGVFAPQDAFASCSNDNNNHCYAQMELDGISNNTGILNNLYIQCLYYPDTSAFDSNEMWDGNGTYWVEDGVTSGVDHYGNYHDKSWFWADSRPNGGDYNEHYNSGWKQAVAGTSYLEEILYVGNDDWKVYGANSYILLGTSTSQPPMSGRVMNAGSEYTANSNSGIRDIGKSTGLEYRDSAQNWHFAGTGGYDASSSNNYFTKNYDGSNSSFTWSGPC